MLLYLVLHLWAGGLLKNPVLLVEFDTEGMFKKKEENKDKSL